jgi:hypothetical protein
MIKLKRHIMIGWLIASLATHLSAARCLAQTAAVPSLPPGVQDVVKLAKAGLSEDVVLTYIKNAGASYNLSADQLIYLQSQSVTQNEIKALLGAGSSSLPAPAPVVARPAPAPLATTQVAAPAAPQYASAPVASEPPPAAAVPAAQPASLALFQAQLAPYGAWMDVPGYGPCWRPTVAATDPYWRPYCDQGHWVYTADGWFWQSDYPWGDIAFHYGRWYRDSLGWMWVPGYDWAPAWVCWRQADGYCGWAPLPPGAIFKAGVGLWFGGHLAVDVDFGLGAEVFTFVPYDHFWDHNLHAFLLPRDRVGIVFSRSVIMNGYRLDHGHFIVEGLGRERMAVYTHHDIRIETPGIHVDVRGHGSHAEMKGHDEREQKGPHEEQRDHRGR